MENKQVFHRGTPFLHPQKLRISFLVITQLVTISCLISLAASVLVLELAPQKTTIQPTRRPPPQKIFSITLKLTTDCGNVKMPVETTQIVNFTPTLRFRRISLIPTMTFSTASFGHPVTLLAFQRKVFFQQHGQLVRMFLYPNTGLVPKPAPTLVRHNVQWVRNMR